ncbi:MAG: hypothetical protein ABR551_13950 [Gemmatimonadales bacterium]
MAAAALLFGVAVSSSACDLDELLTVNDRVTVNPETLENPDVINVVINGALGNFHGAWDGGDAYIAMAGLMSDELYSSGTFPTRTATDRRDQFDPTNGNTSDGAYNSLQFARRALKDAAVKVSAHEDLGASSAEFARLKALEGYTLIALGEGYCSAVPLSGVEAGEFVYGSPLTSSQIIDQAIDRFDTSLGASANHLAAVGKGRALLFQGAYAAAATAVASVPMDYVYHIIHSESGGQNAIFGLQGNGRYSLSTGEGTGGNTIDFVGQGAEYTSSGDPVAPGDDRSPWWGPRPGFDQQIDQYVTLLYNGVGDDTPLASGVEAWLIRAEAAAQTNPAGATALLNELRQNADDLMQGLHDWPVSAGNELADLPAATTTNGAVAQVLEERGFWLLLTGHRLGDLRRAVNQYGIDLYPTGAYHKGGVYGNDVVFPLSFDETNNTNFTLEMCDVTSTSIN